MANVVIITKHPGRHCKDGGDYGFAVDFAGSPMSPEMGVAVYYETTSWLPFNRCQGTFGDERPEDEPEVISIDEVIRRIQAMVTNPPPDEALREQLLRDPATCERWELAWELDGTGHEPWPGESECHICYPS